MNSKDQQAATLAARVIRTARKKKGLSQSTVAKALGMSQGAFSKVESAQYILNAREWFEFCNLTQIIPSSFQSGYIDNKIPVSVHSHEIEGGFRLPKVYAEGAATKVREVRGFLHYFEAQFGEKKMNSFLEHKKLDPDFFVDLDNQINLQFIYDLLETAQEKGTFNSKSVQQIASGFGVPGFHGRVPLFESNLEPIDRVAFLIDQIGFYGSNFKYQIDERSSKKLVLCGSPEDHWFGFKSSKGIEKSLCEYKGLAFQKFASMGSKSSSLVQVHHDECVHEGAKKCIFVAKSA